MSYDRPWNTSPKLQKLIKNVRKSAKHDNVPGSGAMGAWFLGPRGESEPLLEKLVSLALEDAKISRKTAYPNDPKWADTTTPGYKREAERIETQLQILLRRLSRYSIPWYSYGYQAHMNWDTSLPSMAGYFAAMLYNQNNVAAEGSPVTTALEMEVADDLCNMIGFGSGDREPWGHITCDGTVANIEALWAARNVKLYPFAVASLLREIEEKSATLKVRAGHDSKPLVEMEWWELLNLHPDVILDLPETLAEEGMTPSDLKSIEVLTVQHLGLSSFAQKYDDEFDAKGELRKRLDQLKIIAPASCHYSFPKAATLLGLGTSNFIEIPIAANARMDLKLLQSQLESYYNDQIPVIGVVAVIGSTQESAVDDLGELLKLRNDYRTKGFDFLIHADAAWGGYFRSMLRPFPGQENGQSSILKNNSKDTSGVAETAGEDEDFEEGPKLAIQQLDSNSNNDVPVHEGMMFTSKMGMNKHTEAQLELLHMADTVTIDPHKSGFAPYPAGGLCYRDRKMPEMIQITAPIVYHDGEDPTVGVFGIEGSKPGAAPVSVWFSHKIIRPDPTGFGKILGKCIFNSKLFYIELALMESDYFELATLQELTKEEREIIERWPRYSFHELWRHLSGDPASARLFRRIGPDLNINTYAVNPVVPDEKGQPNLNKDLEVANKLNRDVYEALSLEYEGDEWPPIVITGSEYDPEKASETISRLRSQLGLLENGGGAPKTPMRYLLSTTMNPWMSDAEGGTRNMVPEIAARLKAAVERQVKKLWPEEKVNKDKTD